MKVHWFLTLLIFYTTFLISGILIFPSAVFEIINGIIFATIFNGEIYGFFIAMFFFLIFNSISSTLSFSFSKYFFGKRLKEMLVDSSEKMQMLDFVFKTQGFKALGLLRLSPFLPTAILNYVLAAFQSKF